MSEITTNFSPLPARRCLGNLADVRPIIVIDTREQTPLTFTRINAIVGTLQSGDYSIAGAEEAFAIERKSIPDLVACCVGESRERFFRGLHRLRGFRFKRLLIVGTREDIEAGRYRSAITPKAVLATLNAIEVRYDVPVVFAATPDAAAGLIETWAWWAAREIVVSANRLLDGSKAVRESVPQSAGRKAEAVPLSTVVEPPNPA